MTFLVSFAGPAKVGKSTTCKKLTEAINAIDPKIKVDHYAFATPLYEICSVLTGIPVDTLMNQNYKEKEWTENNAPIPALVGWTPRKLLQRVGTECFRNNIHQNFWVQTARNKVKSLDIALMADARFDNEYEESDFVAELMRSGVEYAKDHASAMPPDKKWIDLEIELFEGMDYNIVANKILEEFKKHV